MIDSLSIRNFRGFKSLNISDLRRINVIVGQNSSGKTALLEAIFLAGGGSPEIALRMQAQRGLGQPFQISLDRSSYESLWKYLFFDLDQTETISVQLVGSPANTRSVSVAYSEKEAFTLPLGKSDLESPSIVPVNFEWKDHKGEAFRAQPKITEKGLNLAGVGETMPVFLFASTMPVYSAENATRFSELDTQDRAGVLVETLKREFPLVREVSIQVISGIPTLHATLGHAGFKVPLGLLSGGINKLMAILLAVAGRPQGVILIDEIENGFYYDRLPSIWSALLNISREQNTQIFASTHSQECLNAALSCIRANEDEFSLIRTEQTNGRCTARVFGGSHFQSAIEQNIEVR